MWTEARFYYDSVAPQVSFRAAVPAPPPPRLLRLCPDGVEREFELKAAIRRRQGDYIRIDYRVVSRKPQSLLVRRLWAWSDERVPHLPHP